MSSVLKQTETPTVSIKLCANNIVYVLGKKNATVGEQEMKDNIQEYNKLIEGKLYAFLYYSKDETFVFSHEAITYAKNNQDSFPKVCIAVVVKNLAQRIVAKFYLKFSPQYSPLQIFNSKEEAEKWCLKLLAKQGSAK